MQRLLRDRLEASLGRHDQRQAQHQKLGAIAHARRKQDTIERKAVHDAVARRAPCEVFTPTRPILCGIERLVKRKSGQTIKWHRGSRQ